MAYFVACLIAVVCWLAFMASMPANALSGRAVATAVACFLVFAIVHAAVIRWVGHSRQTTIVPYRVVPPELMPLRLSATLMVEEELKSLGIDQAAAATDAGAAESALNVQRLSEALDD